MINNCFNYVGSKDRIFSAVDKNLDKSKSYFIDLFCGSGVIAVNELLNYDSVIMNDACWQLMETLSYFGKNDTVTVLKEIDDVIEQYNLNKNNREGYNKLRDYYNMNCSQVDNFNPVIFYCLVTHSFNYNIHINKSGGFSVPFGQNRSYFSPSLRTKFANFQSTLYSNKNKIIIDNENYSDLLIKHKSIIKNSMIYVDPPYLSSDSSYGRVSYLGKWDARKEKALHETLDYINKIGGSFLLSNVIKNNGKENTELIKWASRYKIIEVPADYKNCNYQRKNLGETKEVLIRNY